MRKYYSLYGRLLSLPVLYTAFKKVKKNKGAAGVDGQSLEAFEQNLVLELKRLLQELKEKRYQPDAVKRVTIPKDGGGERNLGIPTVRDRIVQQALKNILEPIFDVDMHPSSYGYRPGRSCHHAISKAQLFIRRYERQWVVDMDLSKCFDTLDHDIIIEQIREKVTDGSVLSLIRQFLTSGVLTGLRFDETTRGSPQGGVISPLIANIYLDKFDQFMKSRGHRMIRYADDILVLCKSKRAADNALTVASNYLEKDLKLTVNVAKTHIAHSGDGIKYLGVMIYTEKTRIQEKKLKTFKAKVKQMTKRNRAAPLEEVIKELNPVMRGFANYFRIANCAPWFIELMGWIRRRLRQIELYRWKTWKKLFRKLRQTNYKGKYVKMEMRKWRNTRNYYVSRVMPNKWFHDELGLFDMKTVQCGYSVLEF